MNGGHDLGGMHGFGPINAEPENQEPVFHANWERSVFGLTRAFGALGMFNTDIFRFARESQDPGTYLRHSYYEDWLVAFEKLLLETGVVTTDELATGKSAALADESLRKRHLSGADISRALAPSPVSG